MKPRILKYRLTNDIHTVGTKTVTIEFPKNGIVRDAEPQRGFMCLWVEAFENDDKTITMEEKTFRLYETGDYIDPADIYIKTVHYCGFVWHIHEVKA